MTRAALRALIQRAVYSLRAQALRSALSILGILFGVASITAMSSVTEGARLEALAQIGDLGADTLVVRGAAVSTGAPRPELTVEDALRLRTSLPGVLSVAPLRNAAMEIPGPNGAIPATLVGTDEAYARAARSALSAGRALAPLDIAEGKRVAIVGAEVALAVFPGESPLGRRVEIGGDLFDVIGVLEARAARKSANTPVILGRDLNRSIIVPWNTVPGSGSDLGIDEALIRLTPGASPRTLAAAAKRTIEKSLGPGGMAEVVVPLEVLRQQQRTQAVFAAVTGATSLICLLVGGVGIMNILLASVSERIREIGIRRAVGATREDIAAQFLAEGALLSAGGGALGLAVGITAALLIQSFAAWPIAAAPGIVVLGFLTSIVTGVAAGGYPAWKAAQLEVMDALRQG